MPSGFINNKVKYPSTYHGLRVGDDDVGVYLDGVEKARFTAAGLQLSGGSSIFQGSAPAGGDLVNEDSTSSVNTPLTLVASQSGQVWFNSGSAKRSFVLPAAAAGLKFSFVCADADGIRVQGVSVTDQIRITYADSLPAAWATALTTAGGYIESSVLGARVDLLCLSSAASLAWFGQTTGVWSPLV